MAGRRGGGNGWHDLWSMIVALILLGVLMVGLVSSGGWRVLSGRLGIGNPDAHTSDLTKDRVGVERHEAPPGAEGFGRAGRATARNPGARPGRERGKGSGREDRHGVLAGPIGRDRRDPDGEGEPGRLRP